MLVRVITPPEPVVSLDDAKKHLRVDHADDDGHIEALIAAATAWLDGPAGWLGRALGKQTLELSLADFCHRYVTLPYQPLIDVVSVTYVDDINGTPQILDPDQYRLMGSDLLPAHGMRWPSVCCQPDAVRIQYRAGYGAFSAADPAEWVPALPKPIWVAILMLVGQWYLNRQPIVIGQTVEQLPFAVDALLSTFRVYR